MAIVREELKVMILEDSTGYIIRSRFSQNAEEEKASVYHAAKEIMNDKNNISQLKLDGNIVNDVTIIEDTGSPVYCGLYLIE